MTQQRIAIVEAAAHPYISATITGILWIRYPWTLQRILKPNFLNQALSTQKMNDVASVYNFT